jgi:predicted small lipoprotein YifL
MKKLASLMFCIIFLLSLTACGSSKDKVTSSNSTEVKQTSTIENTGNEESQTNSSTTETSGDYSDFKTGLSTFITDYIDVKEPSYNAIDKSPEKDKFIFELLGIYTPDLIIAQVPMYDALNPLSNGSKVTGKLMLSSIEAYKEKEGDKIKFGSEHTYDKDQGANKNGDKVSTTGYLDTVKNFLMIENKTESKGKVISRSVFEILRLPDATYKMQMFSCNIENSSKIMNETFLSFHKNRYNCILAQSEKNVEFTYKSLGNAGNGELSVEEMSKDYNATFQATVNNGKVVFEKK